MKLIPQGSYNPPEISMRLIFSSDIAWLLEKR
jgi:hypothetical protein